MTKADDEWLEFGPAVLQRIREMAKEMMQSDAEQLLEDPDLRRPVHEQRKIIRKKLHRHGTDVKLNDRDVFGDGDQSPIHLNDKGKQVYRDLFAVGGDITEDANDFATRPDKPSYKRFLYLCIGGNYETVKRILERVTADRKPHHGDVDSALLFFLETRVTSMRLTPLLAIVSMGKFMAFPVGQHKILTENQLKIARLLLLYGARPDARDVCGKTVCHYGAGAMATPITMEVVRMCSAAHQSSHFFGKEVVLHGLQAADLNGKRGIARGFVVQSGRRVVYLIDDEKELALKPENLALADSTTIEPFRKLCDIQDRLGGTALLEVFMSNHVHVGKFLLEELEADPGLADSDGYSPEMMAMQPHGQVSSAIGPMVMQAVMRRRKAEQIAKMNVCAKCQVIGTADKPLMNCSKWYVRSRLLLLQDLNKGCRANSFTC